MYIQGVQSNLPAAEKTQGVKFSKRFYFRSLNDAQDKVEGIKKSGGAAEIVSFRYSKEGPDHWGVISGEKTISKFKEGKAAAKNPWEFARQFFSAPPKKNRKRY